MQLRSANGRNGNSSVRVLHLEEECGDQETVRRMLAEAGLHCEITAVANRAEFVKSVGEKPWDLILAAYALPAFDGSAALKIARHKAPGTPFIFVTGTKGEDVAVETLKNGATDYVLKQKLSRLSPAVLRALSERPEILTSEKDQQYLRWSKERVSFLAYHDLLTSLPNRAFLMEHLPSMIAGADRHKEKLALLFLNLDQFKNINDSLGHSVGDLVLQQIAERLKICSRRQDIVVHLGGNEFVVAVGGIKDCSEAAVAAERIRQTVAAEIQVQGYSLSLACSIGISLFPEHGADPEGLMREANLALYGAKENGRSNWRFFTPDLQAKAQERLTLESGLRRAIERGELFVEYQPQVNLATGRIIGSEALLRWRHPEMGLVPPNAFIPVAEKCGEIVPIGEWVLRTACAQAGKWQHQGVASLPVAVNVSAVQFRQQSFPDTVESVLCDTGLDPSLLELELTESLLLANSDVVDSVMQRLREMGVNLAIDDFGSGYCGLNYLRQFQFCKLKIDRVFVQALGTDSCDDAITAAIIEVARILQMNVIAECAETEEQIRFLREHGCDEVQGFYFSKPLSPGNFAERVLSQRN